MKRSVRLQAAALFLLVMLLALGVGAVVAPQLLPFVALIGLPLLLGAFIGLLIAT
jgi:hypothetical protein